ncbi:MAG: TraR/DksA C4-type zinc finger protein [Chloroflexota bacterium]
MPIQLKERLEAIRADLADEIARERAQLAVDPEGRGEDITPSQHPADVASDLFVRESLLTREIHLEGNASDVEDALRRVHKGTYDICEDCGHPIAKERLEVFPQTARCVDCQRRKERLHPSF